MTIKNILLLTFVLVSNSVFSQASRTYNVYVDTDNNVSTGCMVLQPDFGTQFDGIDGYLALTTSGSPASINSSLYHNCSAGVFDAGSAIVDSSLGLNTNINGDDVFEMQMNTFDLNIRSSANGKLYFTAESATSSDIVVVNNGGGGIFASVAFPIPSLSFVALLLLSLVLYVIAKKVYKNKALIVVSVMLVSTVVWGMFTFVVDGNVDDWTSFNAINDPTGDASGPGNSSDITQVFANLERDLFTARIDVVDVENEAPTINSMATVNVIENQTAVIDVNSSDVDGDVEGVGLTYGITGSVDDALFAIDTNTGVITFLVAPDFEMPADVGGDNDYDIQVTVTDSGGLTDVQDLVVTVTNDVVDDSGVTFQAANSSTVDEATALNVVIVLNALAPLTAPLSVDVVDATGGTATSVTDYTAIGTQTVTFPMGAVNGDTMNAILTPVNDTNVENNETVNLLLQNISGPGVIGAQTTHTATIVEDDLVTVEFATISSATANESTALDVVVQINIPGGGQLDVAVTADAVDAGGGSATSTTDYLAFGTQTVTFAIGSINGSTQNSTLTPIDDAASEGNETVNLVLQNVAGVATASLGAQTTHTAIITDDEASVAFQSATSSTNENSLGLFQTIVLTTPIALASALSIDVVDAGGGSAVSGTDYNAVGTQTVTFPLGAVNGATMTTPSPLQPINDNNVENNETVNLQLQNLVGTGSIGTQSAHVLTIVSDDAATIEFVTATSATVDESTALNVAVSLTIPNGGVLDVALTSEVIDAGGGSATSTTDYAAFGTQPVNFAIGSMSGATVNTTLSPMDDAASEGNETVNLAIQNVAGALLAGAGAQNTHIATIADDDNTAPTAIADAYNSTGNVGINVAAGAGVLFNDTDPEMDMLSVTGFDSASVQGGVVSVAVNGSFTYTPPTGYTGADSFTYTISDGSLPAATFATVSLTVANKVWFVDGSGAAGNGTLATPYNTVAAFEAANGAGGTNPAAGECVFIEAGAYTGPLTLLNNQKVIGKGTSQAIATTCGITLATHSSALPTINGTRPTLTSAGNGINLASGNTLRGFNIGNSPNKLIGTNFGTLSINQMALTGTGKAVDLTTGNAAITIDSINSTNSTTEGVDLNGITGSFTVTGLTTIDNAAQIGVYIQNISANYSFGDVTVNNRNTAGVFINAFTGGVQSGSFGTVTINNQNSSNTTAFGIDNAVSGGTITVSSVAINNNGSSSSAIALSNNEATINIQGGSVQNAAGATVSISSGGGNISYAGTIASVAGRSLQVLNNDGGAITLSGNITDSGTGINVTNNTGATVNFSGTLNLNTTTNTAFNTTGGGTINVTGTGNTIDNSTGTGVNISNTTIGSSGVTFRHVTVNGSANGVNLNNTGSTVGGFTISGIGTTAGSGGIMQNTTGSSVLLTNASNVSLSNLNINNSQFHGIQGITVTNLDLTGVNISSPGNAVNESGIRITNLRGTIVAATANVFNNLTITSASQNGIDINNNTATNAGTTSSPDILTVLNSSISGSANTGILAVTDTASTGNLRLNISGSTLTNNASAGIATNANGGNLQTDITNNTIVHGGGTQFRALSGGATSAGNFFFDVTDNTLISNNGGSGVGPSVIAYANTGSGMMDGSIGGAGVLSNTVTNNTPTGVTSVSGISVINNGSGSSFVQLENNIITVNDGFGIIANVQGINAGVGHFTINDNDVSVEGTDITNTSISLDNNSSSGTKCINIFNNTTSTLPALNVDIVLNNTATSTFQVSQTAVTTSSPHNFFANDTGVEIDVNSAQISSPVGTIVNPFATGSFVPGICTLPLN